MALAPLVDRLKEGFQTHPMADKYFGGHYGGLDLGSFRTVMDRREVVYLDSSPLYEGGVLSAEQFGDVV